MEVNMSLNLPHKVNKEVRILLRFSASDIRVYRIKRTGYVSSKELEGMLEKHVTASVFNSNSGFYRNDMLRSGRYTAALNNFYKLLERNPRAKIIKIKCT
jgi:predicted nucleic acid-binding Zn ribbon protein